MNVLIQNINRTAFPLSLRIRPSHRQFTLSSFVLYHRRYQQRVTARVFGPSTRQLAMTPSKQRAVVVNADGTVGLQEVAVPKPGKGEILIKIAAAAQNPTDW